MRLLTLFFSVLSFSPGFLHASEPIYPCAPTVTIGCTVGCDLKMRAAIQANLPAGTHAVFQRLFTDQKGNRKDLAHDGSPSSIDGILSPGGKDIQPIFYRAQIEDAEKSLYARLDILTGKHTLFSNRRDEFESRLWKRYFSDPAFEEIPAFGICYGHQMMAVSQGFSMFFDLARQLHIPARYDLDDEVTFLRDSRLLGQKNPESETIRRGGRFFGREEHHQAVRETGRVISGARVVGRSNNNQIIESIEYEGRPAYSVQFHPELSEPLEQRLSLTPFLKSVCERSLKPQ